MYAVDDLLKREKLNLFIVIISQEDGIAILETLSEECCEIKPRQFYFVIISN